jgi:hypothetical protein
MGWCLVLIMFFFCELHGRFSCRITCNEGTGHVEYFFGALRLMLDVGKCDVLLILEIF